MLGTAFVIGGVTMLLALGLELMHAVDAVDRQFAGFMGERLGESFPQQLSWWIEWGAALLMAFGMPIGILASRGLWQRLILWVVSSMVMLAWVPVLCLAAYQPEAGLVVFVTFISGGFAVLYAGCRRCGGNDSSSENHEAS